MNERLLHFLDFNIPQQEAAKGITPNTPLPSFHKLSFDELMSAVEQEKIVPRDCCDVFNENVVYCFYGASKFLSTDLYNHGSEGDLSCCVFINTSKVRSPDRIYPFDTGFISSLTSGSTTKLSWTSIQKKLCLGRNVQRIDRMILCFFGGFNDYLSQTITKTNDAIVGLFERDETVTHLKDQESLLLETHRGDDRVFCVELQFLNSLEIDPDSILGFIAPIQFMNGVNDKTKKFILSESDYTFYASSDFENDYELSKFIKQETTERTMKIVDAHV